MLNDTKIQPDDRHEFSPFNLIDENFIYTGGISIAPLSIFSDSGEYSCHTTITSSADSDNVISTIGKGNYLLTIQGKLGFFFGRGGEEGFTCTL